MSSNPVSPRGRFSRTRQWLCIIHAMCLQVRFSFPRSRGAKAATQQLSKFPKIFPTRPASSYASAPHPAPLSFGRFVTSRKSWPCWRCSCKRILAQLLPSASWSYQRLTLCGNVVQICLWGGMPPFDQPARMSPVRHKQALSFRPYYSLIQKLLLQLHFAIGVQ